MTTFFSLEDTNELVLKGHSYISNIGIKIIDEKNCNGSSILEGHFYEFLNLLEIIEIRKDLEITDDKLQQLILRLYGIVENECLYYNSRFIDLDDPMFSGSVTVIGTNNLIFNNGLENNLNTIQLGAPLIRATTIEFANNTFSLSDTNNGLQDMLFYANPNNAITPIFALITDGGLQTGVGTQSVFSVASNINTSGTINGVRMATYNKVGSTILQQEFTIGYTSGATSVGVNSNNPLNTMVFNDTLNNFGIEYLNDYSTKGKLNDRWIPDWGAVKSIVPVVGTYISNQTSLQANSNFNVSGSGQANGFQSFNLVTTGRHIFNGSNNAIAGIGEGYTHSLDLGPTANNDILTQVHLKGTFSTGNAVATVNTIVGGSGYVNGTYTNIQLTNISVVNAVNPTATIIVSGGQVTTVTPNIGSARQQVGNTLVLFNPLALGGSGSGFSCKVNTLSQYTGSTNYQLWVENAPSLFAVSTSGYGSIIIPNGVAYTGTTNGTLWNDGTNLWGYLGGVATRISNQGGITSANNGVNNTSGPVQLGGNLTNSLTSINVGTGSNIFSIGLNPATETTGAIFAVTHASIGMSYNQSGSGQTSIAINQSQFSVGKPIVLNDTINLIGAVYEADYSALGITYDRWIPDYAAVKALDAGTVHLAGVETITGDKTFGGSVTFNPCGLCAITFNGGAINFSQGLTVPGGSITMSNGSPINFSPSGYSLNSNSAGYFSIYNSSTLTGIQLLSDGRVLNGANIELLTVTEGDTNYIHNSSTYQSGAVFNTNKGIVSGTPTSSVYNTSFFPVQAFGDSITVGYGATNPATTSYIPLISTSTGWVITNHAVSGSQVPDQAPFVYVLRPINQSISTLYLGTNDQNVYGINTNKQAVFQTGHEALIAWLAIPTSGKILGTSSSITYTGTWTATSAYGIGKNTSDNGATATFSVTGQNILIGMIQGDGFITGTYTITIDGVSQGSFTGVPLGTLHTQNGATFGPQLLVFKGLTNTSHTVVITTTNTGGVYLDWAAGVVNGVTTGPKVYVSNTTYQTAAIYASFGTNSANTDSYNTTIAANISELSGMGLNVSLVNSNSVVNPLTQLFDGLHPNDSGYSAIASQFITAFGAIPSPPVNDSNILSVYSNANANAFILNNNTSTGTTATAGIQLQNDDTVNAAYIYRTSSTYNLSETPNTLALLNTNGDISFSSSAYEVMRVVSSNHSVAIGTTTSPNGLLTVAGKVIINDSSSYVNALNNGSLQIPVGGMSVGGNIFGGNGIRLVGSTSPSGATFAFGLSLTTSNVNTGTTSGISAISASVSTFAGSYTTTNVHLIDLSSGISKGASHTITNAYGMKLPQVTQGTNNINLLFGTTNTGNWSIYNNSAYSNYSLSKWLIGSSTDNSQGILQIAGNIVPSTTGTQSVGTATTVFNTGYFKTLNLTGSTSGTATIQAPAVAGSAVITFPGVTATLATLAGTETLTNKTLTSPTLTTPTLGVATATSINKVTITAPTTNATLTLIQGSTLATAGAFSTTLTATNNTNVTLPITGTLATLGGTETFTSKTLTSPIINVGSDTTGDIYYRNSGGLYTRLAIGSTGNVLTVAGGLPSWSSPTPINRSHTIFTPTTGGTVTLVTAQINIVNPAGTLATLTIALPSSPSNNDIVNIIFTQSVTAITYSGGTVVGSPTTASLGGQWYLTYDSGTTTWY